LEVCLHIFFLSDVYKSMCLVGHIVICMHVYGYRVDSIEGFYTLYRFDYKRLLDQFKERD